MKKILSVVLAAVMLASVLTISASAKGTLVFEDDFEMGFKALNWIQGPACEFKWNSEGKCLIGYESALVLQPNFNSRNGRKWDQFYSGYEFQVRGFDDITGDRESHDVGIWYRDLFENAEGSQGAVYTMFITIETGKVVINKSHTFQFRDGNGILQEGKIECVLAETMLPGAENLEEGEYAIEVDEYAPWHEIGLRVTSGKIEWYYDHQLLATTEAQPDDEKLGDFAVSSVDATVGSQKSPVLFWNVGNYIAVDNFIVMTPDYDFATVTYGDVNDDTKINLGDASLLLKKIAKWDVTLNETAADVNCDGKINLGDASLLLKKIAKWDVELGPQA